MPQGSDASYLKKLDKALGAHAHYGGGDASRVGAAAAAAAAGGGAGGNRTTFTVRHYAGDVTYRCSKNNPASRKCGIRRRVVQARGQMHLRQERVVVGVDPERAECAATSLEFSSLIIIPIHSHAHTSAPAHLYALRSATGLLEKNRDTLVRDLVRSEFSCCVCRVVCVCVRVSKPPKMS